MTYAPNTILDILPGDVRPFTDLDLSGNHLAWLVYRFVPRDAFTMLYGAGGVGKSSWAAWLTTIARAQGLNVGVAISEEQPELFAMKVRLSAPHQDLTGIYDIGSSWQFPRDGARLIDLIVERNLGFIYFDSIMSHFEQNAGSANLNAAERTRIALTPIVAACHAHNCTIVGTFHENKAGSYLGSTEMRNVVRSLLHMTRKDGGPARLRVEKTNNTHPRHELTFHATAMPAEVDGLTPWTEAGPNGEILPRELMIIQSHEEVPEAGEAETFTLDDLTEGSARKQSRNDEIRKLAASGMRQSEIASKLGISQPTVSRAIAQSGEGEWRDP